MLAVTAFGQMTHAIRGRKEAHTGWEPFPLMISHDRSSHVSRQQSYRFAAALLAAFLAAAAVAQEPPSVPEEELITSAFKNRSTWLTLVCESDEPTTFETQGPNNGTVTAVHSVDNTTAVVLFEPTTDFVGEASFQYRAVSSAGPSEWRDVYLHVTPKIIPMMWANHYVNPSSSSNIESIADAIDEWSKVTDTAIVYVTWTKATFKDDADNVFGDPAVVGHETLMSRKPPGFTIIPAMLPGSSREPPATEPGFLVNNWTDVPSNYLIQHERWADVNDPPTTAIDTLAEAVAYLDSLAGANRVHVDLEYALNYYKHPGPGTDALHYYSGEYPHKFTAIDCLDYNDPNYSYCNDVPAHLEYAQNVLANDPNYPALQGCSQDCTEPATCAGFEQPGTGWRDVYNVYPDLSGDGCAASYAGGEVCSRIKGYAGLEIAEPGYHLRMPALKPGSTQEPNTLLYCLDQFNSALLAANPNLRISWCGLGVNGNQWQYADAGLHFNHVSMDVVNAFDDGMANQCDWVISYTIFSDWLTKDDPNPLLPWAIQQHRNQHVNILGGRDRVLAEHMWMKPCSYTGEPNYYSAGSPADPSHANAFDVMLDPLMADTDTVDFGMASFWHTQVTADALDYLLPSGEPRLSAELDCNGNGVPDFIDIQQSTSQDCNGNGVPDECDIASGLTVDCNGNGIPDSCDLANCTGLPWCSDCNANGIPDGCDIAIGTSLDCNLNGIPDTCDIAAATSSDCNSNNVPDECDTDANGNGVPDDCDPDCDNDGTPDWQAIQQGAPDCNFNGIPDTCDIANCSGQPWCSDCDGNGVPDGCDVAAGTSLDCNNNGIPDSCDIASATSLDCNTNNIPDECDIATGTSVDCNLNGVPDNCDIAAATSDDCNNNGVPDECDLDANGNGVPDECDPDCDNDGTPDWQAIQQGAPDCNANGIPDTCDIAHCSGEPWCSDCDANGEPDGCYVAQSTGGDCNNNGVPDFCEIALDSSRDCNWNGIPDECDIASGFSVDTDNDGIPDECGACCDYSTYSCTVVVPSNCAAAYSLYLGDQVDCPSACSCKGDMNCDGVVDANDFNPMDAALVSEAEWRLYLFNQGIDEPSCEFLANGDFDEDGDVDIDDFNNWMSNINNTCPYTPTLN
jgi:hypothetical protein